jgi:hypothetical protein
MLPQISDATLPPPDAIRQTANEVVSRPYYDLGAGPPRDWTPPWWLELLQSIIEWIVEPFRWLFDSLEGLPDAVRWLIVILAALLAAALIGHILYSLITAVRGPSSRKLGAYQSSHRLVDPSELEQEAERAGARGDYIGAIRLLFRAALRRIELAENRNFLPGFTNRELLRRYQATPLGEPIRRLVDVIDTKWYGDSRCEPADYSACRNEHVRIRQQIDAPRTALGA